MDYESVKYVEGFVENIIFRNEDNGYTVFNIVYDDEEITCVGVLSYINTGEFITAQGEFVKHAVYYMQFKVTWYFTNRVYSPGERLEKMALGETPFSIHWSLASFSL